MDLQWCHLPGPSQFLSRVEEDLRVGRNVKLVTTDTTPTDVATVIRNHVHPSECWESISVSEAGPIGPLQFLYRTFVPEHHDIAHKSLRDLVQQESFLGRRIQLNNFSIQNHASWWEFLLQYEQVCRTVDLFHRTILVLVIDGNSEMTALPDDVCMSTHAWKGVVSELDSLLYSGCCIRDRPLPPFQRRLLVNIVSSLGLWDFRVIDKLAALELGELLRPEEVLSAYAAELGWAYKAGEDAIASWERGQIDSYEGEEVVHSALLAAQGLTRELESRVWTGQIRVFMPFLEDRRRTIIRRLDGQLSLPYTTVTGQTITEPGDLEFGHIEHLLQGATERGPSAVRRSEVSLFKRIRNRLAHFEPVELDLLERALPN